MSTCKDCSGKGGMVSAAAGMPISAREYSDWEHAANEVPPEGWQKRAEAR